VRPRSKPILYCKTVLTDWQRTGRFSINKNRFQHGNGGQASTKLKLVLGECPYVTTIKAATERTSTAVFSFRGIDGFRSLDNSGELFTKNRSPDRYPLPIASSTCPVSSLEIEGKTFFNRAVKWQQWCDLNPVHPTEACADPRIEVF